MADHRIEWLSVSELPPAEQNPKTHDLKTLQDSLRRFGFTEPVILDERTGRLVAGHGRREALIGLKAKGQPAPERIRVDDSGDWLVPVIRGISFADEHEAAAYLLASNKLVEAGGWDRPALADVLEGIQANAPLDGIGFDKFQVDTLLAFARSKRSTEDSVPEMKAEPQAKAGDLWQLGEHRLICGDSTDPAIWDRLLADKGKLGAERIDLVFTDPPYGVAYQGGAKAEVIGKARERLRDDGTEKDAARLFRDVLDRLLPAVRPGGAVYVCCASGPALAPFVVEMANRKILRQVIAWAKDRLVMGRSDYHGQWEPILYGWMPGGRHQQPVDRSSSNLWPFERPSKSPLHPTQKPVPLVAHALGSSGKAGDLVADPFGGSGTTLVAAEQLGMRARLIEVSPTYCDAIVGRWEALTGGRAVLTRDS